MGSTSGIRPRPFASVMRPYATIATLLLAGWAAAAAPIDGWPQTRRDAALSGRTPEPALTDPVLQWSSDLTHALTGEPIVVGCNVFVTNAEGEVFDVDVATGSIVWRSLDSFAIAPQTATSALALDDSGVVAAGLPADPAIDELWRNQAALEIAIQSFAVDNGVYPMGPDLEAELVPTFLAAMPWNPIAMRKMMFSWTPSPGDYRYERTTPSSYALGVWWTDGNHIGGNGSCNLLPPTWPITPEQGGRFTGLAASDGSTAFRLTDREPGNGIVPVVAGTELVWTSDERNLRPASGLPPNGRLRVTGLDGTPLRETRTWAPIRGAAARDATTGDLYIARGPDRASPYLDSALRTLLVAVESYQVDNGAPPPTGDLAPLLVPTFLWCMPQHPLEARAMTYQPTPRAGDYDYRYDPIAMSYEIVMWDEDGAPRAIASDGSITLTAADRPPAVIALDPSLTTRWRTPLGSNADDLSPVALRGDGSLVVGTRSGDVVALDGATGGEVWRSPAGGPITFAPSVAADGRVVVVTDNGFVVSLAPGGGPEWSYPLGGPPGAAPALTADGVAYSPAANGTLRAIDRAGMLLWSLALGGTRRAALTTTAVQSDGWVFVGRDDGVLLALSPSATLGGPAPLGNSLRMVRRGGDIAFEWLANPPGIPLALSHVVRKGVQAILMPTDPRALIVPPDPMLETGAIAAAPSLAFYRVLPATRCGTEGP